MSAAMAIPGNTADTFLVHIFGTGLEDDRYVVERFKAHADGDIRPWPGEAPAKGKGRQAKRVTATLKAVREMRPACTEINLHGPAHARRRPGLGLHRGRSPVRSQAAGLSGASGGRPAAPVGRPPPGFQPRQGGHDDDRAGHRAQTRAGPGALSQAGRRAQGEGPLPEVREAPARAPSQSVRAMRREAPSRRPRQPSPAHRRTCRPGSLPEVREAAARGRPDPVRAVRRHAKPRQPRPRREAPGGRDAAKGPGPGQAL